MTVARTHTRAHTRLWLKHSFNGCIRDTSEHFTRRSREKAALKQQDVQPPKQLWRRPAGSYGCDGPVDVVIQAEDVPAGVTWRDLSAKTNTQLQGFPPLWGCRVLKEKALKWSPIFKNHSAVLSVSCMTAEEGIFCPLLYPQHLDSDRHIRGALQMFWNEEHIFNEYCKISFNIHPHFLKWQKPTAFWVPNP